MADHVGIMRRAGQRCLYHDSCNASNLWYNDDAFRFNFLTPCNICITSEFQWCVMGTSNSFNSDESIDDHLYFCCNWRDDFFYYYWYNDCVAKRHQIRHLTNFKSKKNHDTLYRASISK